MRALFVSSLAVLASLALAATAEAAMVVRMTLTPSAPVAGIPATVSVRTLVPTSRRCVDDPAADHYPWSDWHTSSGQLDLVVRATRDGKEWIDVALARHASDPTLWEGTLVFRSAGDWTLRMARPEWSQAGDDAERCAGARIDVRVVDGLPITSRSTPLDALVALAGATLAVGAWSRRRMLRRILKTVL